MQWIVTFCVLSAIASALCLLASLHVARSVSLRWDSLQKSIRFAESQARLAVTSVTEWQEVTQDLANQVKMHKVRKALKHSDPDASRAPDPRIDPEGWRAWQNRNLKPGVFNQ